MRMHMSIGLTDSLNQDLHAAVDRIAVGQGSGLDIVRGRDKDLRGACDFKINRMRDRIPIALAKSLIARDGPDIKGEPGKLLRPVRLAGKINLDPDDIRIRIRFEMAHGPARHDPIGIKQRNSHALVLKIHHGPGNLRLNHGNMDQAERFNARMAGIA